MNLNGDICYVLRQQISISYNLLVFVDYIIMISNETAFGRGSLFLYLIFNIKETLASYNY